MSYSATYPPVQRRSHGGLVLAAIGATLAMLPLALFQGLFYLEVINMNDFYGFSAISVLATLVGMIFWIIGMFVCIPAMHRNHATGTPILGAITLIVAFSAVIFSFLTETIYDFIYAMKSGYFYTIIYIFGILYIVVHIILACICRRFARFAPGMGCASTGYWTIALLPAIAVVCIKLTESGTMHISTLEVLLKAIPSVIFVSVLLCVIGWWIGAAKGIGTDEDDISYYTNGEETVETYVQTDYTTQPEQIATQPDYSQYQPPRPAIQPLAPDFKEKMMSMSDETLNGIISSQGIYSGAYVEAARSIMAKRRAWESINSFDDTMLINIVNDEGQPYETRDAASMELYSRQSPLLFNELNTLSPHELQNIVNNPSAYLDGYVAAAQQILG